MYSPTFAHARLRLSDAPGVRPPYRLALSRFAYIVVLVYFHPCYASAVPQGSRETPVPGDVLKVYRFVSAFPPYIPCYLRLNNV